MKIKKDKADLSRLEKKKIHNSIQEIVKRNISQFTYFNRKEPFYFLADWYITEKGFHNRFTKAFLRTLKKIGKQERGKK